MAGLYDYGDTVILEAVWRDPEHAEYPGDASLVDPDAVTCSVLKPDGTQIEVDTARQSLGHWTASVTASASGSWEARFTAAGTWDGVETTSFLVRGSAFA